MAQFKGFHGITIHGTPCWVSNAGVLKDGTPAYKITLGAFRGYTGDHSVKRLVAYNGKTGWVRKEVVSKL